MAFLQNRSRAIFPKTMRLLVLIFLRKSNVEILSTHQPSFVATKESC